MYDVAVNTSLVSLVSFAADSTYHPKNRTFVPALHPARSPRNTRLEATGPDIVLLRSVQSLGSVNCSSCPSMCQATHVPCGRDLCRALRHHTYPCILTNIQAASRVKYSIHPHFRIAFYPTQRPVTFPRLLLTVTSISAPPCDLLLYPARSPHPATTLLTATNLGAANVLPPSRDLYLGTKTYTSRRHVGLGSWLVWWRRSEAERCAQKGHPPVARAVGNAQQAREAPSKPNGRTGRSGT